MLDLDQVMLMATAANAPSRSTATATAKGHSMLTIACQSTRHSSSSTMSLGTDSRSSTATTVARSTASDLSKQVDIGGTTKEAIEVDSAAGWVVDIELGWVMVVIVEGMIGVGAARVLLR